MNAIMDMIMGITTDYKKQYILIVDGKKYDKVISMQPKKAAFNLVHKYISIKGLKRGNLIFQIQNIDTEQVYDYVCCIENNNIIVLDD